MERNLCKCNTRCRCFGCKYGLWSLLFGDVRFSAAVRPMLHLDAVVQLAFADDLSTRLLLALLGGSNSGASNIGRRTKGSTSTLTSLHVTPSSVELAIVRALPLGQPGGGAGGGVGQCPHLGQGGAFLSQ